MQARCWLATGSRSYRPLIGTTPVPQSMPQSVSYILLYHPGRRDFPGPVGSEDISSSSLPVTQSVQAMARIRWPRHSLLHASSGLVGTPLSRTLSSERAFRSRPSPPRAPLLQRHYPLSLLLRAHAQIPVPLSSISCPALIGGAPAACTIHGWSSGPSRFELPFFPGVLRPLYRRFVGCT